MRIPSVTEVIGFGNAAAFAHIPAARLEAAQDHGLDFHSLAAAYAQSLWLPEVPEDCQEEFESFTAWYDHVVVPPPVLVEKQLVHPVWNYSGRPDWIGVLRGHPGLTLLDWKPYGAISPAWRLQVAAYRELARANGYPVERVGVVQRQKGKRARFKDLSDTLANDFAVFTCGLTWWRFFNAA